MRRCHGAQGKHEPQRFVGDLLKAEISEKQARSIKYQLTVAKLPLAKDVDDFAFKDNRSMRLSCAIWRAAASSPNSANIVWSAEPAQARPIWPSHRAELHPRWFAAGLSSHR